MEDFKKCKRCKQSKPLTEFYTNNRCQSCKDYMDEYYKNHRQESIKRALKNINKDRVKTNKYKRELNRKNPRNYILQHVRGRAKKLGLPFDLTIDDIVIPDVCPILGIALAISNDYVSANSPSIDRLIPEVGYVKGNIAIISHKANTIKNNASVEELEKVLIWMKNKIQTSI